MCFWLLVSFPEVSAKNISDIGKVMAIVMKKGGGKVDGGIANRIAKELLQ